MGRWGTLLATLVAFSDAPKSWNLFRRCCRRSHIDPGVGSSLLVNLTRAARLRRLVALHESTTKHERMDALGGYYLMGVRHRIMTLRNGMHCLAA